MVLLSRIAKASRYEPRGCCRMSGVCLSLELTQHHWIQKSRFHCLSAITPHVFHIWPQVTPCFPRGEGNITSEIPPSGRLLLCPCLSTKFNGIKKQLLQFLLQKKDRSQRLLPMHPPLQKPLPLASASVTGQNRLSSIALFGGACP